MALEPKPTPVGLEEAVKVTTTVQDPVLDVPQTERITLEKEAMQDIEAQQQGIAWEDVLAGKVQKLGDLNINQQVLDYAQKNPKAMVALRARWARFGQAAQPGEDVEIAFTRAGQVAVPETITDPLMKDAATRYAEGRIGLNEMLVPYVEDAAVRQVLVDRFRTGDFYESLEARLAEAGQFVVTGPTMGYVMGKHALGAYADSKAKGTDWSSEWSARGTDMQRELDAKFKAIDSVLPRPTMKMAFNDAILGEFQRQLDNEEITQEQFNALAMEEIDGELRPKEFISQETADNLLTFAFNELPLSEKFGVMFVENVIGMTGPGGVKGAKALRDFQKLKESYKGTRIGKLIEDVDDPFEAATIINNAEGKTKINLKSLSVGVSQQRTSAAMGRLNNELRETDIEMDALIRRGVAQNSAEFKQLEGRRQLLIDRKMQSIYTLKAYPFLKEGVEDALMLSAGQLFAREYLSTSYEMDPNSAEAIGMLTMALGGVGVTRWVGGKAVNFTSAPRGGVTTFMPQVADFLTFGKYKGFRFTDNTIREYEEATGVALSAEQRKAVNYTIRLINNTTDPVARQKILDSVDDYVALQDRIVLQFPEELQEQAKDLFNLSFAQSSALSPLAALHALSINKIDARNLKGYDAGYMVDLMEQADAQVRATEMALDNFQNFVNGAGEMANRETVQSMIDNSRNALASYRDNLNRRGEEHLEIINGIRKQIMQDPTIDVPEGFLEQLVETSVGIKNRLGTLVDERREIGEVTTDIYNGITQRVAVVKTYRGKGAGYESALSRNLEDAFDAHLESFHARGKAAYSNVVKVTKDAPPIDMHDSVTDFISKAGETDMARFFSPEGQFFAGRMGRITYRVFDDMVKRTIPQEVMGEIKDALKANGFSEELVAGMTDLEMALEFQRISPNFRPFAQANPYEVDEMRRAFRDYAYRISDSKPALSAEVNAFATNLDTLIRKQNPQAYAELEKARKIYRDEVGDRLRSGGSLRRLDDSRQGGEKVTVDTGDMTRYRYKNINPSTVFDGVTTKITGALKGERSAQKSLRGLIDDLETDWADRVNGQNVFDLDNPEGLAKFNAIKDMISEQVYADWAERAISVFERVEGTSSLVKGGGYNFKNLADEDVVNGLMTVTVRKNGEILEVPIMDLGAMYSDARDISRLVKESKVVRDRYNDFVAEFNDLTGEARLNATNNINKDKDALDILSRFSVDVTPDQFYDQYILNGNATKFETLRDTFISGVVQSGKSADEAENMFDTAVRNLVSKGFMNRGGLQPVEGMTMTAITGDKLKVRQFVTPNVMLGDVQENREMLNMILGPDHVDYLTDIADFLDRAGLNRSNRQGVEGIVRGYSLNEGLSRLYNISRGMVSPLYVTSEFAVRLASQSGIEIMQLAAGNKDAARIINNMFNYPELVTRTDVENFDAIVREFVFTEMARMGQQTVAEYPEMELEGETE